MHNITEIKNKLTHKHRVPPDVDLFKLFLNVLDQMRGVRNKKYLSPLLRIHISCLVNNFIRTMQAIKPLIGRGFITCDAYYLQMNNIICFCLFINIISHYNTTIVKTIFYIPLSPSGNVVFQNKFQYFMW